MLSAFNRCPGLSAGVLCCCILCKTETAISVLANAFNGKPIVLFQNFGNSSLDFTLRCWAENIDNWYLSQSELRFAINQIFEENDITIPFPQSDVYIKEFAKHEKQNPHEIDEEK